MIKRLWLWFWTPSKYRLGSIACFCFAAGIIFWGGFNTFMDYTNTTAFCISCHEMRKPYEEYEKTPHATNNSGVKAICSDCHVPKNWTDKLIRKIYATNELFHWAMGTIDTPEQFEAKRLEMAERVWASMIESDSRECRNCHTFKSMTIEKQKEEARKQHAKALKKRETCIECHKGIAHKMPDLGSLTEVVLKNLQKAAAFVDLNAKTLYPIQTKTFFLSPEQSEDADGRVLAAAPLTVLERRGDLLKVRIDGWQQEDVTPMIYALPGKRIFVAALGERARGKVRRFESVVDPLSDLTWYRAEMIGWVNANNLVSDREDLWAYASELYYANCSLCHRLPDADEFPANQWIGIAKEMKDLTNLDTEQYRLSLIYLQLHASDTAGALHK